MLNEFYFHGHLTQLHYEAPWALPVSIPSKKNPIPSVHVLWAFLLSSAEFLWVVFTFIGQMDPVIIHYDGTCLTGPKSPHLLGGESPGAMLRACKYHFWIRAKVLMKFQPWQRGPFLDLTPSCPKMINEHNLTKCFSGSTLISGSHPSTIWFPNPHHFQEGSSK